MPWQPLEDGTKVQHHLDGYVGFIEGVTENCEGPKRNPDGKTQYRVRIKSTSTITLATADELEILKGPSKNKAHNVYVIQLEGVPLGTGKDVYVGMTGKTPEERYDQHKRGYLAASIVTRHGGSNFAQIYMPI